MGNLCWRSQGAKAIMRDVSCVQDGLKRKQREYEDLQNANFHMASEIRRLHAENKLLHAARIEILAGQHKINSHKAQALMRGIRDDAKLVELSQLQPQSMETAAAPKQRLLRTLETEHDNADSDTEVASDDINNLYDEMMQPVQTQLQLASDEYLQSILQPDQLAVQATAAQQPPSQSVSLDAALECIRPLPLPPQTLPLATAQKDDEDQDEERTVAVLDA